MSDFDTALERLLTDPGFAAALAADPTAALAGYQLTAEEQELLRTQMGGAGGGSTAAVETRANQSSAFGLLSPLTGMMGGFGDIGAAAGAVDEALGSAGAQSGFGPAGAQSGFGPAGSGGGFGSAGEDSGFGARPEGAGPPVPDRSAGLGTAPQPVEPAVPEDYRTRVDVDGDGEWDRHIVRGRADGGVDILVDQDGDGRADFVGRDDDADGLVDSAAYDTDGDGFFEQTHYDDDGDGWLDRSVTNQPPPTGPPPPTPPSPPPAGGGLIGDNLRLPEELR
ncbi:MULTISPECIES: Os1348 family NHLP clan protein [unclassified Solwaraspora]|uniref:Os1348 family NHLP clan protein n=1 Tax=unclassified Solwaraspora TaxID=2627926 RepID=UPI00248BA1DE|nr:MULTISPECIES: Os1348 family NHLP clan protein [unclassified Solwaraspora]WBB98118.1 Os1348 family NHLP clan protein [Solwaraspora sp. WMMA2059]WBC23327.1 Os1348 family NHLP clan protein [Solwaraspora sp. WMMA2080]WJK34590.1 Os1348 family NHLP clan protein [Solwaraspora sp. WMMA2065]